MDRKVQQNLSNPGQSTRRNQNLTRFEWQVAGLEYLVEQPGLGRQRFAGPVL
jgi:hypothetical protein